MKKNGRAFLAAIAIAAFAFLLPRHVAAGEGPGGALGRAIVFHDRDGFTEAIRDGADWRGAGLADDQVMSLAAAFDADAAVQLLSSRGVAVDALDGNGETALFAAVAGGAPAATQELLALGADPDRAVTSRRAPSWTPLFAAAADGHVEIVRTLLAAPRRVSQGDNPAATEVVMARLDATDRYGRTALFYAVLHGQTEVVRVLIDAGAATDREDAGGDTVAGLARTLGRAAELEMLAAAAPAPGVKP